MLFPHVQVCCLFVFLGLFLGFFFAIIFLFLSWIQRFGLMPILLMLPSLSFLNSSTVPLFFASSSYYCNNFYDLNLEMATDFLWKHQEAVAHSSLSEQISYPVDIFWGPSFWLGPLMSTWHWRYLLNSLHQPNGNFGMHIGNILLVKIRDQQIPLWHSRISLGSLSQHLWFHAMHCQPQRHIEFDI